MHSLSLMVLIAYSLGLFASALPAVQIPRASSVGGTLVHTLGLKTGRSIFHRAASPGQETMDDDTNYRGISIPKIVDQIALHGDGIHGYYRAGDGQGSNGFRVLQVLRGGAPIIALSSFLGDCRSMNIKNWRLPSEGLAPFDCTLLTGQILFELLFPVKAGGPLKTIWWIGSVDKGTLTVTGNKMFVKATTGNSPGRKSLSLNWSQINLNDHMQFLTQLGLLQMNPLALLADEDAFTTLCRQVVSDEVIAQQDPFISATDLIVKQLKSPTSQTVLAEIYPPWAALWKPLTELDN